jgi:hypothetical protein
MTKIRIYLLIFLAAILTRIFVFVTTDRSYINPDSYTYHILAVNLAKGNGYTTNLSAPYEPNFTRDPAYPFFMSLVYRGYNVFHELTIVPYDKIESNSLGGLLFSPDEILWIRLVQMILSSFSCIFFYLILLYVFKPKYALLIAILFAIYFPYTYNDISILRESFQSSLTIITSYFFLSFVKKNKTIYLVIFGVLWGILNLTLQTSLIIGFFFPILLLIITRNFRKTIVSTIIASLAMLLTVCPYLLRAYKFYPDIKVVRSMGCSVTVEKVNYYKTFIKLMDLGYISHQKFDSLKIELWSLPEYQTFEKSFNGEFDKLTYNLHIKYPIQASIERKYLFKKILVCAKNTWFKNLYKDTESRFIDYLKRFDFLMLIPFFLGILFGLLGFAGFVVYFRNTFPLLLIFFSIVSIFFLIGDESRRSLPAHPYIFMFGILMIITLYNLWEKKSMNEIRNSLFNGNGEILGSN